MKYDDIIRLPHPPSARHPRMPMAARAAQFSPFAALVGHGDAIAETARLADRRIELEDADRAELDRLSAQVEIPSLRIGRRVIFSRERLKQWAQSGQQEV